MRRRRHPLDCVVKQCLFRLCSAWQRQPRSSKLLRTISEYTAACENLWFLEIILETAGGTPGFRNSRDGYSTFPKSCRASMRRRRHPLDCVVKQCLFRLCSAWQRQPRSSELLRTISEYTAARENLWFLEIILETAGGTPGFRNSRDGYSTFPKSCRAPV
jgi:hypothetical protein